MKGAPAQHTPDPASTRRGRRGPPRGSRSLGLLTYGWGWDDHDYRSLPGPIWVAERPYTPPPLTFDAALSRVAPDVILLDAHLRDYFTHHRDQETDLNAWLAQHNGRLVASIEDTTYGALDIYWVQP